MSEEKRFNVDAALRAWPKDERELGGDDVEAKVLGRLDETLPAAEIDLFAAPLPRAEDEPERDRAKDRQSLQELARMARDAKAAKGDGAEQKEDSGIVHLAAAAKADPGAAARAETAPLASESLFEEPAPRVAARASAESPRRTNNVVALFIAFAAAAAGVFFFARTPSSVTTTTATATPAATVATAEPKQVEPPPAAPVVTASDPNALPAAPVVAASPPASAGGPRIAKNDAPPTAKPAPDATGGAGALAAQATSPEDLASALKKEMGDRELRPAAAVSGGSRGDIPQRPSQGAVSGALGSVLPEARACLGPDDPISHATVIFGSDGTVQSVTVTGAAAGKGPEGCIKSALMRAKVQAFSDPTFSSSITIRHN